ncbi:MAG: hypothetical protein ACI4HI_09605 [Lachnospiraceae bacterium]
MSAKTKIVVLHMKELIYTAIFLALGILLVVLLVAMFHNKGEKTETTARFTPGVYTASVPFKDQAVEVEVTVDADHINDVSIANLSETVTTMYPLMEPTVEKLKKQIVKTQSVENLTYDKENQYTSELVIQAIQDAVKKAENKADEKS